MVDACLNRILQLGILTEVRDSYRSPPTITELMGTATLPTNSIASVTDRRGELSFRNTSANPGIYRNKSMNWRSVGPHMLEGRYVLSPFQKLDDLPI